MSLNDYHTSGSRNALRNVLMSWPLSAVRDFFESDLHIPLKAEPTGKMFPQSEQPLDVVDALLDRLARVGAKLAAGVRLTHIEAVSGANGTRFDLTTADGWTVHAARVILATGGMSLPKTGSDGAGLAMARRLGVATVPTSPALVPLLTADPRWKRLAGVAVPTRIRAVQGEHCVDEREREFLFTHRGFSGPVVLDMSRHLTAVPAAGAPTVRLLVRWGGGDAGTWEATLRSSGKRLITTMLRDRLPERLAEELVAVAGVSAARREHQLTRPERQQLLQALDAFELPAHGNEGYATAEVTAGGVALGAIESRTLECRAVPGLHVCGEIVDVVGRIGGYNFLWAWVSGRRAGEGAARLDQG
jgi:predicted Rossmann fold flavoprotein